MNYRTKGYSDECQMQLSPVGTFAHLAFISDSALLWAWPDGSWFSARFHDWGGFAIAAFLLALTDLVIFALGFLYLLRRIDEERRRRHQDALAHPIRLEATIVRPSDSTGKVAVVSVPMSEKPALPEPVLIEPQPAVLPKIVLSEHLIPSLHIYFTDFLCQHGSDQEAGALLVGEIVENNGEREFRVCGFIPAGPKASFSTGSILFDTNWQAQVLAALRIEHPNLIDVGIVHRHPGQFDRCSWGDEQDDRQSVQAAPSKALIFGIVTINNPKQDPLSTYYQNLKIDLFLMAEATGFQYVKVKPTFADIPLVEPAPSLLALCSNDRARCAFFDFAILRNLGAQVFVQSIEADRGNGVLCTIIPANGPGPIEVRCWNSGALQVRFRDPADGLCSVHGPWESPEVGPHVWLAHLMLTVMAAALPGPCEMHPSTPTPPQSQGETYVPTSAAE